MGHSCRRPRLYGDSAEAGQAVAKFVNSKRVAIDVETTSKREEDVLVECRRWSRENKVLNPQSADVRLIQLYDGGAEPAILDVYEVPAPRAGAAHLRAACGALRRLRRSILGCRIRAESTQLHLRSRPGSTDTGHCDL